METTKEIYTKNVFVTPEYAKMLLEKNVSNRSLNKVTVDWYARQMKEGQWTVSGQSISISDKDTLLDGQHRLAAIIKANVSLWFVIAFNVPYNSFINYDNMRTRGTSDAFYIEGIKNNIKISATISKYKGLKTGNLSYAGFGVGGKGLAGVKKNIKYTNKEALEIYYSNAELFQEITNLSKILCNRKALFTETQIGAIMYYLIIDKMNDKDEVFSFFIQLFTNENVKNKTIYYLREKLIDDAMNQYKMTPRMKYVFLVKAWNAYITKKEFKRFIYKEEDNFIQFI